MLLGFVQLPDSHALSALAVGDPPLDLGTLLDAQVRSVWITPA